MVCFASVILMLNLMMKNINTNESRHGFLYNSGSMTWCLLL